MGLNDHQKQNLRLSSISLGVGESSRDIKCPECNVSGDFVVTRHDLGLLYICHRASCGVRGFLSSNPGIKTKEKAPTKVKIFTKRTELPTEFQYRWFVERYNVTSTELNRNGVVWCPETQRMIFPCYTENGYIWGHNARYYKELALSKDVYDSPKSILYPGTYKGPKATFARGSVASKQIVLVEDQVSAIRLSTDVSAIALLGHDVPDDLWEKIRTREVIIALDADVTRKVGNILEQNTLKVHSIRAIALKEDIKDMRPSDYRMFIDKVYKL